jgi:hypothetical protein
MEREDCWRRATWIEHILEKQVNSVQTTRGPDVPPVRSSASSGAIAVEGAGPWTATGRQETGIGGAQHAKALARGRGGRAAQSGWVGSSEHAEAPSLGRGRDVPLPWRPSLWSQHPRRRRLSRAVATLLFFFFFNGESKWDFLENCCPRE